MVWDFEFQECLCVQRLSKSLNKDLVMEEGFSRKGAKAQRRKDAKAQRRKALSRFGVFSLRLCVFARRNVA
jgi:hypothetical protein